MIIKRIVTLTPDLTPEPTTNEGMWRAVLTGDYPAVRRARHLLAMIPSEQRCKNCSAPLQGIGAPLMRLIGRSRYEKNPKFCTHCLEFCRRCPGGAEVELTLLFADVRGSTSLGESLSAAQFTQLMNRFYRAASDAIVRRDGMVDQLVGDQVKGMFLPALARDQHARQAVHAAADLLEATGHGNPGGPWLGVGVGVHTAVAYVGTVSGSDGVFTDFTALGDPVNVTARLSSAAQAGEVLVTDAAASASKLDLSRAPDRQLQLKGRAGPVSVRVVDTRMIRAAAN